MNGVDPQEPSEPTRLDARDRELEQLLVQARVAPAPAWVHETERRLLPARAAQPARRRIGFAAALVGGLAAVVTIAGLAGGGPLAADGGDDARAKPGCTTVYVTKVEDAGKLVQDPDGTVRVETAREPVTRAEQRCP